MTATRAPMPDQLSPRVAWSQRVRKVGGFVQLAFAAFWLVRGGLSVGGLTGSSLAAAGVGIAVIVVVYAIRVSTGIGGRPTSVAAKGIERSVSIATTIELIASFAFPIIVISAGHSDWVLPSIAITIGPLLLWLHHVVGIARLRPVGWVLTVVPFVLVAVMSGSALAATTGLGAGILLWGTAAAGFHDLALIGPVGRRNDVRLSPGTP